VIYLDSSALVKLVRAEDASEALQSWIDQRAATPLMTSALARAEVLRAVRRNNHTDTGALIDPEAFESELAQAAEVLDAIAQIAVDDTVLHRAGLIRRLSAWADPGPARRTTGRLVRGPTGRRRSRRSPVRSRRSAPSR
jgi:predicted nucleic acid-binding protein